MPDFTSYNPPSDYERVQEHYRYQKELWLKLFVDKVVKSTCKTLEEYEKLVNDNIRTKQNFDSEYLT